MLVSLQRGVQQDLGRPRALPLPCCLTWSELPASLGLCLSVCFWRHIRTCHLKGPSGPVRMPHWCLRQAMVFSLPSAPWQGLAAGYCVPRGGSKPLQLRMTELQPYLLSELSGIYLYIDWLCFEHFLWILFCFAYFRQCLTGSPASWPESNCIDQAVLE